MNHHKPPQDRPVGEGFVRVVLTNGDFFEAQPDSLDEDETAIYGTTLNGHNFALPLNNLLYVVEGE
jgi:hypothetical protein